MSTCAFQFIFGIAEEVWFRNPNGVSDQVTRQRMISFQIFFPLLFHISLALCEARTALYLLFAGPASAAVFTDFAKG